MIARDITYRKQAEAAARERDAHALRYVRSLAATAAHEINNPLTAVKAYGQLLASRSDGTWRRWVSEILEATGRIEEIVDRLQHINRLELIDAPHPVPTMLDLEKSSREG